MTTRTNIVVPAALGCILSLYALYVEHKVAPSSKDEPTPDEENFSALCDIEAIGASCSAVFTLPVGHLVSYLGLVPVGHVLDVPNALLGVIYYTYLLLLEFFVSPRSKSAVPWSVLTPVVTCLAFGSSVMLAYQLTFVIKELCILCWTTHVINTLLLYRLVVAPSRKSRADSSATKKVKRV